MAQSSGSDMHKSRTFICLPFSQSSTLHAKIIFSLVFLGFCNGLCLKGENSNDTAGEICALKLYLNSLLLQNCVESWGRCITAKSQNFTDVRLVTLWCLNSLHPYIKMYFLHAAPCIFLRHWQGKFVWQFWTSLVLIIFFILMTFMIDSVVLLQREIRP